MYDSSITEWLRLAATSGGHLVQPRFSSRATRSWLPRWLYCTFKSYSSKRRMNSSEPVRKGRVIRQRRQAEYMGYKKTTSGVHLQWTFPHPHMTVTTACLPYTEDTCAHGPSMGSQWSTKPNKVQEQSFRFVAVDTHGCQKQFLLFFS